MRIRQLRLAFFLALSGWLGPALTHAAPVYTVQDLGLLPGYVSSTATSVDNNGEVVGYDTDVSGNTQAFYWTQGARGGP